MSETELRAPTERFRISGVVYVCSSLQPLVPALPAKMKWLKHPVLWHSSRIPSGYNYTAMTTDQRAMLTEPFLFVSRSQRV
jgi:hypothetical protein